MCGIFGFSKITDRTRIMAPLLANAMELRGDDSWGATNGRETIKHLGSILDTWDLPDWQRGIFHTRAASVGAVTIENQHPFSFDHFDPAGTFVRRVVGIHNGHISNHEALSTQYERKFDVDSMHVFAHIAEGRDVREIHGWGALAWYEYDQDLNGVDGVLHLCRFNMTDLAIAKLETGEVVFASTDTALARACRMTHVKYTMYTVVSEINYTIRPDPERPDHDILARGPQLPFGFRHASTSTSNSSYGHWNGRAWTDYSTGGSSGAPGTRQRPNIYTVGEHARSSNTCAKVACNRKVRATRREELLCIECMADIVRDMDREGFALK